MDIHFNSSPITFPRYVVVENISNQIQLKMLTMLIMLIMSHLLYKMYLNIFTLLYKYNLPMIEQSTKLQL